MVRLPRACALLALVSGGACLDVPPYRPCGAADRDCDGWPVTGNPATTDCNDDDGNISPGAVDDPATAPVEDCFAVGAAVTLPPVTAAVAGWRVGELALEFDSVSKMPSSLRLMDVELLGSNTDSCVRDERAAGVSVYPAFAVDDQSIQAGQAIALRAGPALATTRVTWAQAVPMASATFGCDAATTVTGTIDFTVQPNGRVVRYDRVAVSAGVTSCAGCGDVDGNPPIFTSYVTFADLDRYQIEPAVTSIAFPPGGAATSLPAPTGPLTGCVTGPNADSPQVAMAWRFPTPVAGMRARTTGDGQLNRGLVVDWVNGAALGAGTYELATALAAEDDANVECSASLRAAMAEFARPPTLSDTSFIAERGVYRYTGPEQVGVTITASQGVEAGAVIEVPNVSERGVTVWRSTGASYVRLRRGTDYLLQFEQAPGAAPTAVVYLPTLAGGSSIVVASPGGEPPA